MPETHAELRQQVRLHVLEPFAQLTAVELISVLCLSAVELMLVLLRYVELMPFAERRSVVLIHVPFMHCAGPICVRQMHAVHSERHTRSCALLMRAVHILRKAKAMRVTRVTRAMLRRLT